MKNYVQPGKTLPFTASAALVAGAGVILAGSTFGVNNYDVATGEVGEATIEGVFNLPKAAQVTTAFATAYWDNTAKVTTTTASGNTKIGFYTEAGASAAITPVRLIPQA